MTNDFFDTFSQTTETAFETARKIGEANLKCAEKLWRGQVELATSLFKATREGSEKVFGTKDPQAFASNQAELAQECGQILLEGCKAYGDVLSETGKSYGQVFEAGVKNANSNFSAKGGAKAAGGTKSA